MNAHTKKTEKFPGLKIVKSLQASLDKFEKQGGNPFSDEKIAGETILRCLIKAHHQGASCLWSVLIVLLRIRFGSIVFDNYESEVQTHLKKYQDDVSGSEMIWKYILLPLGGLRNLKDHFLSARGLTYEFHDKLEANCASFGVDKKVAISILACLKHFVGDMPASYRFEDSEKARECLLPVLLEAFCGENGFHPNQGLFVTKGGKAYCLLPNGKLGGTKATIHEWSSFNGAEDGILHLRNADGSFNWPLGKAECRLLEGAISFLKEEVTTQTAQQFSDVILSRFSVPSFHSPTRVATAKVQPTGPKVVVPEQSQAAPAPQSSLSELLKEVQKAKDAAKIAVLKLRSEQERVETEFRAIEMQIDEAEKAHEANMQKLREQLSVKESAITSLDQQIQEAEQLLQ